MPRRVKGSGKASETGKKAKVPEKKTVAAKTSQKVAAPAVRVVRKYPSYSERIAAADKKIAQLTVLNDRRAALIAKTEATLAHRQDALAKSETLLKKTQAKKEKIIAAMNRPPKVAKPKLDPEALAARRREALVKARESKKAKREKYDELMSTLSFNGRSIDDLLLALKSMK